MTYMSCRKYIFRDSKRLTNRRNNENHEHCPFSHEELQEMFHPKLGIDEKLFEFVVTELEPRQVSEIRVEFPDDVDWGFYSHSYRNVKKMNILISLIQLFHPRIILHILKNIRDVPPNDQEYSAMRLLFRYSPNDLYHSRNKRMKSMAGKYDFDSLILEFIMDPQVDEKMGKKNTGYCLNISCSNGFSKCCKYLLKNGGKFTEDEYESNFQQASQKKHIQIMEMFYEYDDFSLAHRPYEGPFISACKNGYDNVVKSMLDWGKVDPLNKPYKTNRGDSTIPMIAAVEWGRPVIVRLLAKYLGERNLLDPEVLKKGIIFASKKLPKDYLTKQLGWKKVPIFAHFNFSKRSLYVKDITIVRLVVWRTVYVKFVRKNVMVVMKL